MLSKDQVLDVLSRHIGGSRGITAAELATIVDGGDSALVRRQIRKHIKALRLEGTPICGHPTTGYFIARTDEELQDTCIFLHKRAMSSLSLVCAMKRLPMPNLAGQLRLPEDTK